MATGTGIRVVVVSNVDVTSAALRYRFVDEDSRNPTTTFRSSVESFFKGKYNEMKQHLNIGLFSNSVCDN